MFHFAPRTADLFEDTAPPQPTDSFEALGFEIGWAFARYGLVPPVEHLSAGQPVCQGWQAGHAVFGTRTLKATPHARKWLQLRLNAWLGGQVFEGLQVTPHFLAQIDVALCPVTRKPLDNASGTDCDAVVERVCNKAGYAAGNLTVISVHAKRAKADHTWDEALRRVRQIEAGQLAQIDGLDAAQWARLAVLMSFATPLPHSQAAGLPLLVLPPNRLRVLNPVQALQVLLTLHLMPGGQRSRIADLAAAVPAAARHEFNVFMLTLQARRLAAGGLSDGPELRQAIEDAWALDVLQRRWQRFALLLTEADCEQLVQRLARRGLARSDWQWLPKAAATEGWALETGGLRRPAAAMAASQAMVQGRGRVRLSQRGARPFDANPCGSGFAGASLTKN